MTTLESKMREWAKANRLPWDDDTWDQNCGRAMFRFNSWLGWATAPRGDISSAWRAAMGSGRLNTDRSQAPPAAWHWYDIGGPDNGHVMQDVFGGGGTTFGATRAARSIEGATALGFLSVQGYLDARPAAKYLGWSTNYSGGRPSLAGLSSSNSIPLEDDMPTPKDLLEAQFDSGQRNPDGSPRVVSLFQALQAVYFYGDRLNALIEKMPADVWAHPLVHPLADVVNGQPARVAAGELLRFEPAEHDNTRRAVAAAITRGTNVDIDYDTLVASLKGTGLDPQAIAVFAADEADRRERARLAQ